MMRFSIVCSIFASILFLSPSCVQLEGQRITFYFDEAQDKLLILMYYDGIHESQSPVGDRGKEQIPAFVENRDIMFLDWIGHLSMSKLNEMTEKEDQPIQIRSLAKRLLRDVKVHNLGWFRHFNGHISAAQLVEIYHAKELIKTINTTICASILKEENIEDDDAPRTMEKIREAARKDQKWISLDGHSLRATFPVDTREWAALKYESFAKELFNLNDKDRVKLAQTLSAVPLSYQESNGTVSIQIGVRDVPSVFRFSLHSDYEPSLEEIVIKYLPVALDPLIVDAVLEGGCDSSLEPILYWGPPEELVRAVVNSLHAGVDESSALEWLKSFAEKWNENEGIPHAPTMNEDMELYLKQWKNWYDSMITYPG